MDRAVRGQPFRKMLFMIVIATDMGVHADFMKRFEQLVSGGVQIEFEQRVLVCQAIIKCADISNPVRHFVLFRDHVVVLIGAESTVSSLERLGRGARIRMGEPEAAGATSPSTHVCKARK